MTSVDSGNGSKGPRVLIVKEHVDVFGPDRPVQFAKTAPRALLELFPFKVTYWETSTLLRSDWIIVRSQMDSLQRSYVESIKHLAPIIENQCRFAIPLSELDTSQYDILISLEPCLSPLRQLFRRRHWFYFHNEHLNERYEESNALPSRPYGGFLDHMCGGKTNNTDVDNSRRFSIAFPYLRDPETVRTFFPRKRGSTKPVAWVDARSIMFEANGSWAGTWSAACDRHLQKLESETGIRIVTRSQIYNDFYNAAGDAAAYLEEMSQADFYVGIATGGPGQALCDAASLGLVCFGTDKLIYHTMICTPDRLCSSVVGGLTSAMKVYESADKMLAAIREQDTALHQSFQHAPLRRLFSRANIPLSETSHFLPANKLGAHTHSLQ
jgi:hypothetical protein